jgi:CHAD domain-containing protein
VLDELLPLRAGLGAAFSGAIAYAQAMAEAAGRDPVHAVHEYRKAVRRARAVVRLARPIVPRRAFSALNQELRQAVAASSATRDAHVLEAALEHLPGRSSDPARRAAREALEAIRAEQGSTQGAQRVLRHGAWTLNGLPARFFESLPRDVCWLDLESGLRGSYRRARKARAEAGRTGDFAAIHDFRKRVKELRYQLELLEAAAELALKRDHQQLARLAQRLGTVTDLIALRRLVAGRPELDSAAGRRLVRATDGRIALLLARELPRTAALFEKRPRRFVARIMRRLRAA